MLLCGNCILLAHLCMCLAVDRPKAEIIEVIVDSIVIRFGNSYMLTKTSSGWMFDWKKLSNDVFAWLGSMALEE